MATQDCALCLDPAALAEAPPRERVHVTDNWRVVAHRSGLPGWLLVVPRRHIETLSEFSDAEAAELGPILRAATRTLQTVVGAEKTYALMFAEGTRHVHFSVPPRMPDHPKDRRGAGVMAYNRDDEPIDDARRDELAHQLIAAWSATGRGPDK